MSLPLNANLRLAPIPFGSRLSLISSKSGEGPVSSPAVLRSPTCTARARRRPPGIRSGFFHHLTRVHAR